MIAVLGGGISGLAAAYQLQKEGKNFILLEADKELGGKIKSRHLNGYTFELGPNTVLINNPEIKQLLDELDLSKNIILPDEKAVKNRLVLKNGKLEAIPTSLKSAFKSNLFQVKTIFNLIKEPFITQKKTSEEESLADFSRRRFGKQIYEDFITPFVTGIYAGDPEKMSINHTLSILNNAEKASGSVIKGMMKIMKKKKRENEFHQLPKQKIFTFQTGLSKLIETLRDKLLNNIQTEAFVTQISQIDKSVYEISYNLKGEKRKIEVQEIISTLPAHNLANIIQNLSVELFHSLQKINYVPAVVSHIGLPKSVLNFQEKAFGILSRQAEKVPFLGVLFNSHFFPSHAPAEKVLLTVITGGYRQKDMVDLSDEDILIEIKEALRSTIGLDKVEMTHVHKWPKGIPQFEMGYQNILDQITRFEEKYPSFYISGNFREGISVSDCIANNVKLVKKIVS